VRHEPRRWGGGEADLLRQLILKRIQQITPNDLDELIAAFNIKKVKKLCQHAF
jgi:hypothetical protein